jgi:hypothetical protein
VDQGIEAKQKKKSKGCLWFALGGVAILVICFALLINAGSKSQFALEGFKAKIRDAALADVTEEHYPELYKLLGEDAVGRANNLSQWAAIVAAEHSLCDQLEILEVSSKSTPAKIEWFADCTNGKRFQITEEEAADAQRRWEPVETEAAKEVTSPVEPNSAAVENVSEVKVVSGCDRMAKAAMKSRGSYDASWSYDYRKHPAEGQVSVTREFEAQNSFGATLSSEYVCIVDAKSMTPVSIRIREATGWETIYGQ